MTWDEMVIHAKTPSEVFDLAMQRMEFLEQALNELHEENQRLRNAIKLERMEKR